MELLERDHHDDPEFDALLPRVGCGVCGRTVQTVPLNRAGVRGAYQAAADDEDALRIRVAFEGPMASWSRDHAATHTEADHRRAAAE